MNARQLVLIFAVALVGIGLILTVMDLLGEEAPEQRISVARAAQQIEPYTPIDQNMIVVEEMRARQARDIGAWQDTQVIGMMATDLIEQGEPLTAGNALPAEDYRLSGDLDKELMSFQASVDRLVAGQLRGGQLINIYGINRGGGDVEPYTVLIQPNVRLVRVFAGGGRIAGLGTPEPDWDTGQPSFSAADRPQTASLLTVEVTPEEAYNLIDALGAKGLEPYVTLAGSTVAFDRATPPAQAQAPAQPTEPAIDIAATMTAIWDELQQATQVAPPPTGG